MIKEKLSDFIKKGSSLISTISVRTISVILPVTIAKWAFLFFLEPSSQAVCVKDMLALSLGL
jgi:hypothetical protein